mmetsp:Transcript_12959/g.29803  ORF Transcript_12959/g.29803 Transcript_12959/m.29803 type:complete len:218 (+) Transcript_12959:1536-2189(+)
MCLAMSALTCAMDRFTLSSSDLSSSSARLDFCSSSLCRSATSCSRFLTSSSSFFLCSYSSRLCSTIVAVCLAKATNFSSALSAPSDILNSISNAMVTHSFRDDSLNFARSFRISMNRLGNPDSSSMLRKTGSAANVSDLISLCTCMISDTTLAQDLLSRNSDEACTASTQLSNAFRMFVTAIPSGSCMFAWGLPSDARKAETDLSCCISDTTKFNEF